MIKGKAPGQAKKTLKTNQNLTKKENFRMAKLSLNTKQREKLRQTLKKELKALGLEEIKIVIRDNIKKDKEKVVIKEE